VWYKSVVLYEVMKEGYLNYSSKVLVSWVTEWGNGTTVSYSGLNK
jgi:hypothetical protein